MIECFLSMVALRAIFRVDPLGCFYHVVVSERLTCVVVIRGNPLILLSDAGFVLVFFQTTDHCIPVRLEEFVIYRGVWKVAKCGLQVVNEQKPVSGVLEELVMIGRPAATPVPLEMFQQQLLS